MTTDQKIELKKISDYCWEIPKTGNMNVPGRIYANKKLLDSIKHDESLNQVRNVACLPGIVNFSFAMPDIHWGYGFPIGGVAAFDYDTGIISPGGVGYDINCGCRLIRTNLIYDDIKDDLKKLVRVLFQNIPSGVGSKGKIKLSVNEEKKVLKQGARWAIKNGYGYEEDLERTEDWGLLEPCDPEIISDRALERGLRQLGTLGSGNHFLEIGIIEEIYDEKVAKNFSLDKNHITVMIHSGSRGLGYQVCDDFLKKMGSVVRNLGIEIPDRQLACAFINSKVGESYLMGMNCAANYAWTNREIITHFTRETFEKVLKRSPASLGMRLVYDVCHNIAKIEEHEIKGKIHKVCVHRKGATRAFPAGHKKLSPIYRDVGQPVIIPGDMGTNSYILVGGQNSLKETFGSTCHGAGRVLSRTQAKKRCKGRSVDRELEDKGIFVIAEGRSTLAEELPEAYKDVDEVTDVVHNANLSLKVAKIRPIGVIKG
jgi:tRNA-splicing ligase RtcB